MDAEALTRSYYRSIDDGDFDALADLLAPSFAHDRPDRTIEGRDRFVQFMREERPDPDTSHEVATVLVAASGAEAEVAVRGRLLRADGSEWFAFVDVFTVEEGRLVHLRTYTH